MKIKTTKARKLGLGVQFLEVLGQCKFISAGCHAYSYAHIFADFVTV